MDRSKSYWSTFELYGVERSKTEVNRRGGCGYSSWEYDGFGTA
jgi:hypothetical protein